MKILIYTLGLPPYRRGGLTRYSSDLARELSKKNKVTIFFPGRMSLNRNSTKIKFKSLKSNEGFKLYEMINPLPVSLNFGVKEDVLFYKKRDIKNMKKFIDYINPDILHLHTIMGLPVEFLDYIREKGIKIILTTHDFYGLCPKMLENRENRDKLLKKSSCSYDCFLCGTGLSWYKIYLMQSGFYRKLKQNKIVKVIRKIQKNFLVKKKSKNENISDNYSLISEKVKLRKYYLNIGKKIDLFHFNSKVSENYIKNFFPNANGKVLFLSHLNIKDNRKNNYIFFESNKQVNIAYIGPYDEKKGFFLLKRVITKLSEIFDNFHLNLYGDVIDDNLFKRDFVTNHGVIPSAQMDSEYRKMDLLIVPSIWHETFGFGVLEALSYDIPVICSKNVGAKDLVKDSEYIYGDEKELFYKLKYILEDPSILNTYTKNIKKYDLPLDFSKHVNEVKEIYKSVI